MRECGECDTEERLTRVGTEYAECSACGAVYMRNFHGKFIAVAEAVRNMRGRRSRSVEEKVLIKKPVASPAVRAAPRPRRAKKRKRSKRVPRPPEPRRGVEQVPEALATEKPSRPRCRRCSYPCSSTELEDGICEPCRTYGHRSAARHYTS